MRSFSLLYIGASMERPPHSLPCGQHGNSSMLRFRNQPKPSNRERAQVDRHASSAARFFIFMLLGVIIEQPIADAVQLI